MGFWPISHAKELLGKVFAVLKAVERVIVLLWMLLDLNVMAKVTAAILLSSWGWTQHSEKVKAKKTTEKHIYEPKPALLNLPISYNL